MVTGPDVLDPRADSLDDARPFVPEDHWRRRWMHPLLVVKIRVANAARHEPHEHLAGAGLIQFKLLDHERLTGAIQNRGAHYCRAPRP
jgi:hypothetical protein